MTTPPLLDVRDLVVSFRSDAGSFRAVDGVDLQVQGGKTLALVGESGCGKSVTALSIMRLLQDSTGSIDAGEILLDGTDLRGLSAAEMRAVRGDRVSMIFQEPMTAMNPVFTVGAQVMEMFRIHRGYSKSAARDAAIDMLRKVGMPDAERRADEYPFQFSGGMLQRAVIAMALACEPELLIADEPTTALDVTIQAQILDLMRDLQDKLGTSILLITHDLGVVSEFASDVAIMYAGRIVERGGTSTVLVQPQHPYTRGLLASIPTLDDSKVEPLSVIDGAVPGLRDMPSGCRFHPRCDHAQDLCRSDVPGLVPENCQAAVACHLVAGRIRE